MFWFILICAIVVVVVACTKKPQKARPASTAKRYQQLADIADKPSSLVPATSPIRYTTTPGVPLSREVAPDSALRWTGSEMIEVAGYSIQNPQTYISDGATAEDEASCINLELRVGRPVAEERGALGYWPRYSRISSAQRANYLRWLSSGKREPLTDIGYAFIYFYGLERRALVDEEDIEVVLTEANRLMFAYSESRSFFGYSSRFLAFVLARAGLENLPQESFETVFKDSLKELGDEPLAVALAWVLKAEIQLPVWLAFEVAKNDIRSSRSNVVSRVSTAFRALFDRKFSEQFPSGMSLGASARERSIEYLPASPTVVYALGRSLPRIRIPDVLGLSGQFKPLVEIWDACIEELRPLSRLAIKQDVDVESLTRQRYQALPDALKAEIDHPDRDKWDHFVRERTSDSNIVLATLGELAALCGIEERPRLTATQSEDLATTASDIGFVLVPDYRVSRRTYKWGETVALFRPEGRPEPPSDANYRAAVLILEMGIAIAAADGTIEHEEIDHITEFVKGHFLLEPNDARRIEAHRFLLTAQPPTLASVAKRIQAAIAADRLESVCRFLVGIAAANGTVDKRERSSLRRFYQALGLHSTKLDELLASIEASQAEPVEIQRGTIVPGEAIPPKHEAVFTLDETALQSILQETEEVARMLGDALASSSEEEAEIVVTDEARDSAADNSTTHKTPPATSTATLVFEGLEARYQAAITEMMTRDSWTSNEFEALARRHNLMPAGMVETVNAWSDEHHGDFLIEEGESYTVNKSVLGRT